MKIVTSLSVALSFLVAVLVITLGVFSVPAADDYAFLVHARTMSAIDVGVSNFFHWDGRVIHYIIIAALLRNIHTLFIATVLWSVSLVVMSIVVERLLSGVFSFSSAYTDRAVRTGILLCALWLGMRPILGQTVMWATGGVYTCWGAAGLGWLFLLLRRFTSDATQRIVSFRSISGWFLSGALMGAGTQNLSIPLMCATVILMQSVRRLNRRTDMWLLVAVLAGLATGLGTLLSAPGLYHRAALTPGAFNFDPIPLLENLGALVWFYLTLSTKLIPFSVGASAILALMLPVRSWKRAGHVPGAWFWFVLSACTVIPMAMVPDLGMKKHTATFFQIFLALGILNLCIPLFHAFYRRYLTKTGIRMILPLVLTVLLIVPTLLILGRDLTQAVPLRREVFERHQWILENARPGHDLAIPVIQAVVPMSVFFYDLRSDPAHPINGWAADYYLVRSIRTDRSISMEGLDDSQRGSETP